MITDAEVRRLARSACVEPRIVELDWQASVTERVTSFLCGSWDDGMAAQAREPCWPP